MVAEFLKPLDVSDDALGLDAIRDVGPGGHYFGTQHTLSRYENRLLLADPVGLAQQRDMGGGGSPTTFQHANRGLEGKARSL